MVQQWDAIHRKLPGESTLQLGRKHMPSSPVLIHIQHIARAGHVERILGTASGDQPHEVEPARLRLTQDG